MQPQGVSVRALSGINECKILNLREISAFLFLFPFLKSEKENYYSRGKFMIESRMSADMNKK